MSEDEVPKSIYFEDYFLGAQFRSVAYTLEKTEIIEFAQKWDPQPWHIDEAAAKKSMFGGLTACSAHIFSVFCITSQHWEGNVKQKVLASLGFDEMRTLKPVYAGDTLYCRNTVELARLSKSKNDRGIVAVRCEMLNQKEEVVFSVLSSFLMALKPVAP